MEDISLTVDKNTYLSMKKMYESYEDSATGVGTIFKGFDKPGNCFQIKFMEHASDSYFSRKNMYVIYIRKMDCELKLLSYRSKCD